MIGHVLAYDKIKRAAIIIPAAEFKGENTPRNRVLNARSDTVLDVGFSYSFKPRHFWVDNTLFHYELDYSSPGI